MTKPAASKRPKLIPVSDHTRHLSGLLAAELLGWPEVTARPMFGLRSFYRGSVVFAMLPDKRALGTATAVAFKLAGAAGKLESEKWRYLQLNSERDIEPALAALSDAYSAASGR
jgi:hypothetical protein